MGLVINLVAVLLLVVHSIAHRLALLLADHLVRRRNPPHSTTAIFIALSYPMELKLVVEITIVALNPFAWKKIPAVTTA